jgi:hypothetical protein
MYHVGEKVTPPTNGERPRGPRRFPPADLSKNRLRAISEMVRLVSKHLEPTWQGLVLVCPMPALAKRAVHLWPTMVYPVDLILAGYLHDLFLPGAAWVEYGI